MCCKLRDVLIFLAGAEFFHTVSHIILPYFVSLPMDMKFMVLTPMMNVWAIVVNGVITVLLLWWANRLCKVDHKMEKVAKVEPKAKKKK